MGLVPCIGICFVIDLGNALFVSAFKNFRLFDFEINSAITMHDNLKKLESFFLCF